MRTSEAINDLAAALAAAQGEMENAPYNRTNPHFRSKYADLASVRDATVPSLSKHGLAIVQGTGFDTDGSFILTTRLLHASGQWMESVYPLPMMPDKPQVMGSAQTYARRYMWASACGIAAEEDDDANAVQPTNGRKSSAQAKRDGDWERLQHDMTDARSAVSLQRLWNDYRKTVYPAWNADWQREADELFARRMAEFSAGEDLRETLQDSVDNIGAAEAALPKADFAPNARARKQREKAPFSQATAAQVGIYRERVKWLKGATTVQELKTRGANLEHLTELEKLTPHQIDNLREAYAEHAATLQGTLLSQEQ